jgi:pSer/pThr/pTyr-binding forkhead associated (FHA) protein
MLKATLIVSQPGQATQEVESGESLMSIGSALDNIVCLEDDADVARYHAVIERHEDKFLLSDLGTRQGTKVNGEAVFSERELKDGDRIMLGGSVFIEFYSHEATTPRPATEVYTHTPNSFGSSDLSYAVGSAAGSGLSAASSNVSGSRLSGAGNVAAAPPVAALSPSAPVAVENSTEGVSRQAKMLGIGGGLLLTATAALVIFNPFGGSACAASVRILTPPSGTTLRSAATIRVEARETGCIKRVSYQLDGEEIASASGAPYEATLDPRRLPRMSSGNHVLTATIETTDGFQARQSGEVYVAFNAPSGETQQPAATPSKEETSEPPGNNANAGSLVTGTDVQAMAERLASQISGKSGYRFEREMISRIQARTGNFSAASSLERAARQRRIVVKAFSDRGIKPLLGFVLAMSRSGFEDASSREGAGIWRVPHAVAQEYLQPGETLAALDNPQRAAEISAVYLKHLLDIFETENFDLAVACYGSTLEESGALKQRMASIPAVERQNFWQLVERRIISPEQSERVIKFYAAGIVGENPQRFGAADDRRLSALEY